MVAAPMVDQPVIVSETRPCAPEQPIQRQVVWIQLVHAGQGGQAASAELCLLFSVQFGHPARVVIARFIGRHPTIDVFHDIERTAHDGFVLFVEVGLADGYVAVAQLSLHDVLGLEVLIHVLGIVGQCLSTQDVPAAVFQRKEKNLSRTAVGVFGDGFQLDQAVGLQTWSRTRPQSGRDDG